MHPLNILKMLNFGKNIQKDDEEEEGEEKVDETKNNPVLSFFKGEQRNKIEINHQTD